MLWPNRNFASIEFPAGELKNQPLFEIFSNVVKSVIACVAIVSIFAGSLGITTKWITEFSGTFFPSKTSEREISFTQSFLVR